MITELGTHFEGFFLLRFQYTTACATSNKRPNIDSDPMTTTKNERATPIFGHNFDDRLFNGRPAFLNVCAFNVVDDNGDESGGSNSNSCGTVLLLAL